jgi:hypothetical protein
VTNRLDDHEQHVQASAATAAKASWAVENSGPGRLVVKVGSTRQRVARVDTVARAVADPSALKAATRVRSAPTSRQTPTMPLQVIITAANTVSRARVAASSGVLDAIRVTIRATSMTVTATASTSEPNGSPTRWATTSAWCTAASTEAASSTPTTTSTRTGGFLALQVAASTTTASGGTTPVHAGRRSRRSTATASPPAR